MISTQFSDLNLSAPILKALAEEDHHTPTPIQIEAIPLILEGKDILATAQTGTGKTAAFALPMLKVLHETKPPRAHHIRALILTPTRELALQIESNFKTYGRHLPLSTTVVLGGVSSFSQIKALRKGPDILVATPGRLIDLYNQGYIRLDRVSMFVLDEADRMLDMGFVNDVRRIASYLPPKRQTMLFSATLTSDVMHLATGMLDSPVRIEVSPPSSVSLNIHQKVMFVDHIDKKQLLTGILSDVGVSRALVFARTKRQADRITRALTSSGISADAIHSDKTQNARQKALNAFDRGRIKVLVGTDIVARGIDVDGISHVINYELPNDPESYVHRIGRTARAGADGIALSFCSADQISLLSGIEKLIKQTLTEIDDHPFHSAYISAMRGRMASKSAPSAPSRPHGRKNRRPSSRGNRMSRR